MTRNVQLGRLDEIVAQSGRLVELQTLLLDYTGHVRADLSASQRKTMVAEIQHLRSAIGWPNLDMTGRARVERRSHAD